MTNIISHLKKKFCLKLPMQKIFLLTVYSVFWCYEEVIYYQSRINPTFSGSTDFLRRCTQA